MKSFFSVILILLTTQLNFAQKFSLIDSIPINNRTIHSIETDLNQSIYLISDTKVEKIFGSNKIRIYDNKSIINHVDSSNPLRFYLFSNLNRISILDEDLNPIQDPITIPTKDFMPSALKISDNQFCWFYDLIGNKLVYYNYQLQKTILNSKPIFLKDGDQTIEQIHLYKNKLYLKSQHHIYIYDDYGNFKSNFEIEQDLKTTYFYKNYIFYTKNNKLYSINLDSQITTNFIQLANTKSIAINESNLYSLGENYIFKYNIESIQDVKN